MIEFDRIYHCDCIEGMKEIQDKSVDLILTDPPYGTTAHDWDRVVPFDVMWNQFERIIKNDGIIAIFATQPFTTNLISYKIDLWRYNWRTTEIRL